MTKWQTLAGIVVLLAVIGCAGYSPPTLTEENITWMIDSLQLLAPTQEMSNQIEQWQTDYAGDIEALVNLYNDICEMFDAEDVFAPPGAQHPVKLVD